MRILRKVSTIFLLAASHIFEISSLRKRAQVEHNILIFSSSSLEDIVARLVSGYITLCKTRLVEHHSIFTLWSFEINYSSFKNLTSCFSRSQAYRSLFCRTPCSFRTLEFPRRGVLLRPLRFDGTPRFPSSEFAIVAHVERHTHTLSMTVQPPPPIPQQPLPLY